MAAAFRTKRRGNGQIPWPLPSSPISAVFPDKSPSTAWCRAAGALPTQGTTHEPLGWHKTPPQGWDAAEIGASHGAGSTGEGFPSAATPNPSPSGLQKEFCFQKTLLRAKAELSAPTERQEGAVRPILISLRQENWDISANMGLFRALFVHKAVLFFNFAPLSLLPSSSPRPLP